MMLANATRLPVCVSGDLGRFVASIGRTEDIRFSPDRKRLAVAEFEAQRINLIDFEIAGSDGRPEVRVSGFQALCCPAFDYPHGLAFIGNDRLVVANRKGAVIVVKMPQRADPVVEHQLDPEVMMTGGRLVRLYSPGSVVVYEKKPGVYEALVGNNYTHRVTRHRIDLRNGVRPGRHRLLLTRGLKIPDGLCLDRRREWLAVSNHSRHEVFVYDYRRRLGPISRPDAQLQGIAYPHGLQFAAEGSLLLVADAGAPLVHVFERPGDNWSGRLQPIRSVRVMDDATFRRGHYNEKEGGPKGLDLLEDRNVMVTSNAYQPLAFFQLSSVVPQASGVVREDPTRGPVPSPLPAQGAPRSRTA